MAKRTTKFTKELGEQLVERIRECGSVERACTDLGFFGASVRKRVRTHPDDDFGLLVGAELEANRKRWRTSKQKAAKKRVAKPGNGAKPLPVGEPASHTESRPGVLEVEELARSTAGAATLERAVLELSERVKVLEEDAERDRLDVTSAFAMLRQGADASPTLPAAPLTRIHAHLEALSYVVDTVPVAGVLRLLEHFHDEEEAE